MATHKEHLTCHYNSCIKKVGLHFCKYCGNAYCAEHLKPLPPSLPGGWFKHSSHKDIFNIEDWRNPNAHPCPPYYDYLVAEAKKMDEEYQKSLEDLVKSGKQPRGGHPPKGPTAPPSGKKDGNESKKELIKSIKIILLLAFFVVVASYVLQNSSELTNKLSDIKMGLFSNQYTPKEIRIYDCKIYPDKCKNYTVHTNISVNAEQQNTTQPDETLTENKPIAPPLIVNETPARPQKGTYWKEGVGWVPPGSEYDKK